MLLCQEVLTALGGGQAGICALTACESSRVLIAADNWGMVYVFDIKDTLESAKSALPPTSAPLVGPVQHTKFKTHDETISCLIYVKTRRLIVTGRDNHSPATAAITTARVQLSRAM